MQQKQHLLMLRILGHRRRHLQPQSRSRLQITQSGIELGLRRRQQQRMRLQRPVPSHQPVQFGKPHRFLTQGGKPHLQGHDATITIDHGTVADQQTGQ